MTKDKSIESAIEKLKSEKFETYGVRCPMCGTLLLRPKVVNRETGQKMAGACPNVETYEENGRLTRKECGYMEPIKKQTIPNKAQLSVSARKNNSLGYLTSYSIFSNFSVFNHRFDNYTTDTIDEKQALEHCETVARRIMKRQVVHSLLLGPTGLGKTHLAVGMMYYILEQSGYKYQVVVRKNGESKKVDIPWKILFIDWRALISEKKASFNDKSLATSLAKTMTAIKQADIVILDDFGSERKTDYSLDLADEFWRYREDKTVIITTNLVGQELADQYGERLLSRMKNHGVGNSFAFKGQDHRGGSQ